MLASCLKPTCYVISYNFHPRCFREIIVICDRFELIRETMVANKEHKFLIYLRYPTFLMQDHFLIIERHHPGSNGEFQRFAEFTLPCSVDGTKVIAAWYFPELVRMHAFIDQ